MTSVAIMERNLSRSRRGRGFRADALRLGAANAFNRLSLLTFHVWQGAQPLGCGPLSQIDNA